MNPFVNYNEDRECTSDPEAEGQPPCDIEPTGEDAMDRWARLQWERRHEASGYLEFEGQR
jgi:hypothetical protein